MHMTKQLFFAIASVIGIASEAQALRGEEWNIFFNSYVDNCVVEQNADPERSNIGIEKIENYCRCVGTKVADVVHSMDDSIAIKQESTQAYQSCNEWLLDSMENG